MTWAVLYALGAMLWLGVMALIGLVIPTEAERSATRRVAVRIAPVWPYGVAVMIWALAVCIQQHFQGRG